MLTQMPFGGTSRSQVRNIGCQMGLETQSATFFVFCFFSSRIDTSNQLKQPLR